MYKTGNSNKVSLIRPYRNGWSTSCKQPAAVTTLLHIFLLPTSWNTSVWNSNRYVMSPAWIALAIVNVYLSIAIALLRIPVRCKMQFVSVLRCFILGNNFVSHILPFHLITQLVCNIFRYTVLSFIIHVYQKLMFRIKTHTDFYILAYINAYIEKFLQQIKKNICNLLLLNAVTNRVSSAIMNTNIVTKIYPNFGRSLVNLVGELWVDRIRPTLIPSTVVRKARSCLLTRLLMKLSVYTELNVYLNI